MHVHACTMSMFFTQWNYLHLDGIVCDVRYSIPIAFIFILINWLKMNEDESILQLKLISSFILHHYH